MIRAYSSWKSNPVVWFWFLIEFVNLDEQVFYLFFVYFTHTRITIYKLYIFFLTWVVSCQTLQHNGIYMNV